MATHKPIYKSSLKDAKLHDEVQEWRQSYQENCTCARAIEKAIKENHNGIYLDKDATKSILEEFGFDRTYWVLANTILQKSTDTRYSESNREWADKYYIPNDEIRWHYEVQEKPELVNAFLNRVNETWQSLGLFDKSHITDESHYEGKLLVMKPSVLKDEFKTPEFQLFYATSGFGCDPDKIGTQVSGYFLKDGEFAHFRRHNFFGVIKDECIPEWAQEKLKEYQDETIDESIDLEGN